MAIRTSLGEDDLAATSLATINEESSHGASLSEDGEENGPAADGGDCDGPASSPEPEGSLDPIAHGVDDNGDDRKEKARRKKRTKHKSAESAAAIAAALYSQDHDTAQQILVDLCTEMKDLKASMQATTGAVAANLASNQEVLTGLNERMEGLQTSLAQIDATIESRATPEQIEELARIRAVQEMLRVVTDDKERTVQLYEAHAMRGYEEIERLRGDLEAERKETARLRAELVAVRGERWPVPPMAASGAVPNVDSFTGPLGGPRAVYVGGSTRSLRGGGEFDDMTLETKGSYDTVAYETKSLKKRILHMKKKLAVAQADAKEAGDLRAEAERLRVEGEAVRRAGAAKDARIQELEATVEGQRRGGQLPVAGGRMASGRVQGGGAYVATQAKSAKSAKNTKQPAKKWWSM